MINLEEVLRCAAIFHQAGQFQEAESLYQGILRVAPGHPDANYNLGLMAMQLGRPEHGLPYLQAAWESDPSVGQYWLTLTECLLAQGSFEDALMLSNEAMKHGMRTPQVQELRLRAKRGLDKTPPSAAVVQDVLSLFRSACFAELEERTRQILEQYPGWVLGWSVLGAVLNALGKDAEGALYRAAKLAPHDAEVLNNLGVFLRKQGRLEEASAHFRMALQFKPGYAEAHYNLGTALLDMKQFDEALSSLDLALGIRPAYAEACNCKGLVFKELWRLDEAITNYRKAVEIRPDFVDALLNLAGSLAEQWQTAETLTVLRRALEINPDNVLAYSIWLHTLSQSGDVDPDALFVEHRRFGERFEAPLRSDWREFSNTREPERCLRIGFVSGDLFNHAVASFIEPVLAHFANSSRLELSVYSNHVIEDLVTQRLRGHVKHWYSVAGWSDGLLAEKIRADGIDILFDLSSHNPRNRLLTFARKPAPVQVSWIGYPGTTGLSAMDYYLADRFFLPSGQFDGQFTEKIVRLPAVAPFLPFEDEPPVNVLPALSNGYVTFGSFNRLSKLSQPVIALWSRLLRALPDSRMLLGAMPMDGNYGELIDWFAQEGIAQDRLSFYPRSGMRAYLELHQQVDICLDTFPYTGGTTTCHALRMGVPTLSFAGSTVPGRAAAATLGQVELDDFVALAAEDFVQKGLYWAGNLAALSDCRAALRERFAKSAMGQPAVVAAGVEQALRIMWQRWCAGLLAESFEVSRQELGA